MNRTDSIKKPFKQLLRIFFIIYTVYAIWLAVFYIHIPAIIYLIIAVGMLIKRKKLKIFVPFLLAAMLIPEPTSILKDGGTQVISAVLYDIYIYNRISGYDYDTLKVHYTKGTGIYTLGFVPIYEYKYFEE